MLWLLVLLAAAAAARAGVDAESAFVWHLTDVHVDPWYTVDSDAGKCYCETTAKCQVTGSGCNMTPGVVTAAAKWGNSEGNCATPQSLYESGVAFMGKHKPDANVYFTGDFAEAGASAPCHGSAAATARQQILDIIHWDFETLKKRMPPSTKVFGSLGNHDSVPGDIYYGLNDDGKGQQSWEYNNLTELWGADVGRDPATLATIRRGGYYSSRAAKGLTVISLNINYWVVQNSEASKPGSTAEAEGKRMMEWFGTELAAAAAVGDAVHILGHQPPTDTAWLPGYWGQYAQLCGKFKQTIKGQFYGHIHIDQWTLTRACRNNTAHAGYKKTTGIKWCSGGGDLHPGDLFGAGVEAECPLIPAGWSIDKTVERCNAVCSNASACVGYTLYFNGSAAGAPGGTTPRECCFRTDSVANQPTDPTGTARCYEKPGGEVCDGAAATVLLPGPSLTEGWPATNPSVRLLEFDAKTFELLDAHTFTADLHAANKGGGSDMDWRLEYSFKATFGMADMSAASFELLNAKLAGSAGDATWEKYRGQGDGSLWVGGYDGRSAPFAPLDPVTVCNGTCRAAFVDQLNATDFAP
jgi:hypothetical protein